LHQWKQRNPYKNTKRNNKAFFVPKSEIKENSYDLSINRYQEIEYEKVEYEQPKVILQKLRELENEIQEDLDDLEEFLR
ncbi:MAG: DNA methyltransferase, partial [Cyanobacteria bacterium P01_D01_bin.116]